MTGDEDFRKYLKTAIAILIAWAVFCIGISALTSCKSHKHVTNEHNAKDSLAVVVNDIKFDRKWLESLKSDSLWSNDYLHVKIYDTSKPVDSLTNRPPLVADIRYKKEAGKKTDEKISLADSTIETSNTNIVETHEESDESEEDVKVESKTIPAWRLWLFAAIILLTISCKGFIYNLTTSVLNKIFK